MPDQPQPAMTITYTKLQSGAWGLRVLGQVKAGQVVTVTKKSSETKLEVVGRVVWSGKDQKTQQPVSLCTIHPASSKTRGCWECGCTFTYADCLASGGDWNDSYCGC